MYYENNVSLIGNLGRDPEIRSFSNGGKVANLRIATTKKWKNRESGEVQERTEWHSVAVKGGALVGIVERYVKKGSYVRIVGELQTRKWQDQNGNDRYSTEIVVGGFDGKVGLMDRPGGSGGGDGYSQGSGGGADPGYSQPIDDEIPY